MTITFLILKVFGIPMLEKPYEERADFQEYKRRTSAFFPLVYGVYDMTNMSTLENWSVRMVWVDICWGCFLCGVTTCFAALATQWLA
jgi:uncharacterized membrane protein